MTMLSCRADNTPDLDPKDWFEIYQLYARYSHSIDARDGSVAKIGGSQR